jgi:hypothetical protein
MLALLFSIPVCLHHAVFPRLDAQAIVRRWSPQVHDDMLLSLDGAKRFSRGIIELEDSRSFGVVQSGDLCMNLFVCHKPSTGEYVLRSCLWSTHVVLPARGRVECIQSLREFMNDVDPDSCFLCCADMPDMDVWNATST